MTQQVLVNLIICICGHVQPSSYQQICMEAYVNCAVKYGGDIITQEQFAKQCNFSQHQEICYK